MRWDAGSGWRTLSESGVLLFNGFLLFLHRWSKPQPFPGRKQFRQTPLDFRVETILSCGNALNLVQMHNGCLSDLQRTQLPEAVSALAAKDATDVLELTFFLKVVGLDSFLSTFLVGSEVDTSDACACRSSSSW